MQLRIEQEAGVQILLPEGELVTGEAETLLKAELERLAELGSSRVLVDFSKVPYLDSSVLGQLVYAHSLLKKTGGGLKLLNPSRRIIELLSVTRLIGIFEVYKERKDALESWHADAG